MVNVLLTIGVVNLVINSVILYFLYNLILENTKIKQKRKEAQKAMNDLNKIMGGMAPGGMTGAQNPNGPFAKKRNLVGFKTQNDNR